MIGTFSTQVSGTSYILYSNLDSKSNHISSCILHVHFYTKNLLFLILHINFYKTLISVYLFYHLFYLNNKFSQIFYYFPQLTPIHTCALSLSLYPFFLICCSLYTHLSTSISIFESTLPFGLNPHHLGHNFRSTAPIRQAPISLAPIHQHQSTALIHKHRSLQLQSTSTDLPSSNP